MTRSNRFVVFAATALVTSTACAAQAAGPAAPAPTTEGAKAASAGATTAAPPYRISARAHAGLGVAQLGVAIVGGASVEAWFGDYVAVGPLFEVVAQGTACSLCASSNEDLQAFGVAFAARTAPRGNYGLFTIGPGYAWGKRYTTAGVLGNIPGPPTRERAGLLAVSGGYLFHRGLFELGPMLDVDATTSASVVLTANVAVGIAAR